MKPTRFAVIPVWDGNPHAKIIEPAEGLITRTIREETVSFQRLGSQPGAPGARRGRRWYRWRLRAFRWRCPRYRSGARGSSAAAP